MLRMTSDQQSEWLEHAYCALVSVSVGAVLCGGVNGINVRALILHSSGG